MQAARRRKLLEMASSDNEITPELDIKYPLLSNGHKNLSAIKGK
jgi:hypothetical protein